MTKKKELQRIIRRYKEETGELQIDMKNVAIFAQLMGYEMPTPRGPLDILASELASVPHLT